MGDPWRILSELGTDATMTGLWCAAKACAVLAGAGLLALAMRRRAAATRHLVWVLGLSGALAVLPLSLAVPQWGVPVFEAPPRLEPAIVSSPLLEAQPLEVPTLTEMAMPANMAVATLQAISPIETIATKWPRVSLPLVLWIAGTLAVFAWGVTGWASAWWMGSKADLVTDPIWIAAAREAVERLGTRRRRDTSTWRAGDHAADLGCRAADSAAARRGRRMADRAPTRCTVARTGTRPSSRLSDTLAGTDDMRDILVQPAGLVGGVAAPHRARTSLRRSCAGGGRAAVGLRDAAPRSGTVAPPCASADPRRDGDGSALGTGNEAAGDSRRAAQPARPGAGWRSRAS